jgi:hypothetical protein
VVIAKAYTAVSGGSFVQLAKVYLAPNPNGVAYFDLSQIAETQISPPLTQKGLAPSIPLAGQPIHQIYSVDSSQQQVSRRYVIEVASYNNGQESAVEDSKTVYVIGGTEQLTSGLFPDFTPYAQGQSIGWLTDQKPTYTDMPAYTGATNVIRRKLAKEEDQVIGSLQANQMGYPYSASSPAEYAAYPQTSTGNTGVVTFSLSNFNTGQTNDNLYFFGLGYRALRAQLIISTGPGGNGSIPDPDNIDKCLLGILADGQFVGLPLLVTWDKETNCKNGYTQLAYTNTRGGWDYLLFTNRTPKVFSTESKQYRRSAYNYGGSTFSIAPNAPQYDTYAKTGRRAYTLSDLYFDAAQREQLELALRSKHVQIKRVDADGTYLSEYSDNPWEPANIVTNSVVIQPAGSQFFNVSIDVEVAIDIRC